MPTILIVEGIRVMIYPNDHEPPHVHVRTSSGTLKIELGWFGARLMEESGRIAASERRRTMKIINANLGLCKAAWKRING